MCSLSCEHRQGQLLSEPAQIPGHAEGAECPSTHVKPHFLDAPFFMFSILVRKALLPTVYLTTGTGRQRCLSSLRLWKVRRGE